MILNPANGIPFYRQIEADLAEKIRLGQLAPGSLLPSARQLAADLLVSVITVKQAYDALEESGMVYSQQGRGTFVAMGAAAAAKAQAIAEFRRPVLNALRLARSRGLSAEDLRALTLSLLETP